MKIPLLKNTLTNYILLLVQLGEGVLLVRWMIALMGGELYGFWGILWSFLSYSVLVDFGFGATVRKYTAKGLPQSDLGHYNRIMSTVFAFYGLMTIPILVGTGVVAVFAETLFKMREPTPELVTLCRTAIVIFGCGMALKFPLSLFNSVVVGLQRQYLNNILNLVLKSVEFACIVIIFLCGFSREPTFLALVVLMSLLPVVGCALLGVAVYRRIPGLCLTHGCDRQSFREIFSFSGWVYFGSVARLLEITIAPVLLGSMSGLGFAGTYQVGRRFPQLASQLTAPYQDNASPLSARLYARGRKHALGRILLGFMRWNALLSTGLSALVITFAPELIRFFFGVKATGGAIDFDAAVLVCRIMSVTMWIGIIGKTVPSSAFMMIERHRFQVCVSLAEALVKIALTVWVIRCWPESVSGIAWVALALATVSVLGVSYPMMIYVTQLGYLSVIWKTVVKPFACGVIAIAAARCFASALPEIDFLRLALGGLFCVAVYLPLGIFSLVTPAERRRAFTKIKGSGKRRGLK